MLKKNIIKIFLATGIPIFDPRLDSKFDPRFDPKILKLWGQMAKTVLKIKLNQPKKKTAETLLNSSNLSGLSGSN